MCGIAGFFSFTDWKLSKPDLADMLEDIQTRGMDATGYATLDAPGGKFRYGKQAIKVKEFISGFLNQPEVPVGYAALLHTRSTTVGTEKNNINNHPLLYHDTMVIHNGMLHIPDVDEAYKNLKIEKTAEVDSAIIPVLLDTLGVVKAVEYMNTRLAGSAAIAALMRGGSLFLARDTKPLFVGRTKGGIVWSSVPETILTHTSRKGELGLSWGNLTEVPNGQYRWIGRGGDLLGSGVFVLPVAPVGKWTVPPKFDVRNTICMWPGCAKDSSTALTRSAKLLWFCKKHIQKATNATQLPFKV